MSWTKAYAGFWLVLGKLRSMKARTNTNVGTNVLRMSALLGGVYVRGMGFGLRFHVNRFAGVIDGQSVRMAED